MNCTHQKTTFIPTPETIHHGKTVCADCGAYIRFEKKPETVEREKRNAERIKQLQSIPTLSEWEKGFVESVSKQRKLSPKQQEFLDKIFMEKSR